MNYAIGRRRERELTRARRIIHAVERVASYLVHESRSKGETGCFVLRYENAEERLRSRSGHKPLTDGHEIPCKVTDRFNEEGESDDRSATRLIRMSWRDVARAQWLTQPDVSLAKDIEWLPLHRAMTLAPRLAPALLSYDTRYECLIVLEPPLPLVGEWMYVVQHAGVHQNEGRPTCTTNLYADMYMFDDLVAWSKSGHDPRKINWSDPDFDGDCCARLADDRGIVYEFQMPDGSYVEAGTNLNAKASQEIA